MSKQVVLITGCSRGLGKQLALEFEKKDHKVIRHMGRKHYDLSNVEEIKKLSKYAIENDVELLVNNAALGCPGICFEDYSVEQIDDFINTNLRAPILLSYFLKQNIKNIININSMVGLEVKKFRTLYSATKWGLRGFSNSLKYENQNLTVLDVYPTNIKTKPEMQNAMNIDMVVKKIYTAYINGEHKLILDGRPK